MRMKPFFLILLFSISSFLVAPPLIADPQADFQAGSKAYKNGDFEIAFQRLYPLAEQGHALSQFLLGEMFIDGKGIKKNVPEGIKWYRKAAEQGHAKAQYQIGARYECGCGISQSNTQALEWYQKAAERGYAKAQSTLGIMVRNWQRCLARLCASVYVE